MGTFTYSSLDVDRREGCVGEVVVRNGHVVVATDPDAARRPEAAHGMRLLGNAKLFSSYFKAK